MNIEKIPNEMKRHSCWCVWKRDDGGKIPYNPNTGKRAKSNDRSTFASFEVAHNAYSFGEYTGLGIGIFDDMCAIDIDHCITDGTYSEMATDIIKQMGSYTEISPSGEGIRIIFTAASFPFDKNRYYINNKKKGLEVYLSGATNKFVTITGERINDNPVVDGTAKLPDVLEKYMLRASSLATVHSPISEAPTVNFLQIGLEKDEVLKSYWHGGRPHGNESEDDMGLMGKLMYWCNNNVEQAIQAFCDSPYASQKDSKHQAKLKRHDYLLNLANATFSSETAEQDHEQWLSTHQPQSKQKSSQGLNIISAPDLQKTNFPPTKYFVEELLPEGVSILAAAPKSGKSWLVLLMGLKIATGEPFLQRQTKQVGVLYLSLEDTMRRLKERMEKLLCNAPAPPWFYFSTENITLENGLLDRLDDHIKQHPETKLVIIDTFQKIRGQTMRGERWYDHDYREAGSVKEFADKNGISILLVHHTNKAKDKNPFNEIGGTNGLSGTVDTMFIMKEKSGSSKQKTLYVTGRDVEEAEIVINLNKTTCQWELVGNADEVARRDKLFEYQSSPIPKTIKKLIDESPSGYWKGFCKDIIEKGHQLFNLSIASSSQALGKKLVEIRDLLLEQDGIIYTTSPNGNSGNYQHFCYERERSDTCDEDDYSDVEF